MAGSTASRTSRRSRTRRLESRMRAIEIILYALSPIIFLFRPSRALPLRLDYGPVAAGAHGFEHGDAVLPGALGRGENLVGRVPASLRIAGYQLAARFTVSMGKPGVLIGRRTIGSRFVIDPKKSYLARPPS